MSVCPVYDYCEFCDASYPAEDGNCHQCPECEVCGATVDPDSTDGKYGICPQCYTDASDFDDLAHDAMRNQ